MNDQNKILSFKGLPCDQSEVTRGVVLEKITSVLSECLCFFNQCLYTLSFMWMQDEACAKANLVV